jgi:Uma2 family endonuclease
MNLEPPSGMEPITEPDILASIDDLPTEDDLPCDDGEPMDTPRHQEQMILLIQSLKAYWSARSNYFVGGNMFLYYDPRSRWKVRGPDFFVVLDVEDRERKSWIVWEEGMRFPDVIIELLSDTTREVDKGEKKAIYERVFRTPEYYLYDPVSQEFLGYHLEKNRYRLAEADTEGRVYSSSLDLCLAVRDGWLRWMTPAGSLLPTPMEFAAQERQRAERAEDMVARYKERFGELD